MRIVNPVEAGLADFFRRRAKSPAAAKPVLLVQCAEDPFYFGVFGAIASALRLHGPLRVEQLMFRSVNVAEAASWSRFFLNRVFVNAITSEKWRVLYASYCDAVAYRCNDLGDIVGDLFDLVRAYRVWRRLVRGTNVTTLEIGGVLVGDLVNDTYLRFKPAPTVDVADRYMFHVIWQAYRDVRRAQDYFSKRPPQLFLTSYSTYVQHGIPVRIALQHGVKVFAFGNYQEFCKQLTLQDWMHTKFADTYAQDFAVLDSQQERLAEADAALASRIAGKIDSATAYMKQSPYQERESLAVDASGAAVIFLHDFFDSPNVYYDMVFADFWEWACFTIETLQKAGIRFLVKPHPNQIGLSGGVLDELKQRYPGTAFISSNITNKQLVQAGVICAVTAYGTVAHEMAYLGVPSVMCARHPHSSFGFCVTAKTREQYRDALISCGNFGGDQSVMRNESLAFYYMHNLNHAHDEQEFLEVLGVFRSHCADFFELEQVAGLKAELESIFQMSAFRRHVKKFETCLS
ncbi:hypothetical protein hmeg3_21280 [Herbaspirillum sp. meg3]|nr:hypothetical protein hmeg3_21280 [Herbaspirillum sp. meg3]